MPPSPTFDAFRLARQRETLAGEATMSQLPRLAQSVLDPDARVRYTIEGRIDDEGHPGALMQLAATLPLRCERCNEPVLFRLERRVPFRFARDEQELNARPVEDDEIEEVVGSTAFALLPWLEDEAILSLPLVPRHDDCALPGVAAEPVAEETREYPFAALARLKPGGGGGAGGH